MLYNTSEIICLWLFLKKKLGSSARNGYLGPEPLPGYQINTRVIPAALICSNAYQFRFLRYCNHFLPIPLSNTVKWNWKVKQCCKWSVVCQLYLLDSWVATIWVTSFLHHFINLWLVSSARNGYPSPEPDRYPVPKIPESPSTTWKQQS